MSILWLAIGLALFLAGVRSMTAGLMGLTGSALAQRAQGQDRSVWFGVFYGVGLTALIQSSSASLVIIIGLVQAKMVSVLYGIAMVFGANLGTTVTTYLITLRLEEYSPYIALLGLVFWAYSPTRVGKGLGRALTGLGILFLGLEVMGLAAGPLAQSVGSTLAGWGQFSMLWVGVGITAVLQSSSLVTGLALALSRGGVLSLAQAICVVLGSNVGTCATGFLAAMGLERGARDVAMAHLVFNIAGVVVVFPIVGWVLSWLPGEEIGEQVANFHFILNLVSLAVMAPILVGVQRWQSLKQR